MKKLILLVLASLLSLTVSAQSVGNTTFSHELGSYGINLPYRKAAISPKSSVKPALVLYLHGGSARGDDNETQMQEQGIESVYSYLLDNQISSIMLVPQCPKNMEWGHKMNPFLKSLIDEYMSGGGIDHERIYILGGSMGGRGVWSMLSEYPDLFAAAMPVAGKPFLCNAENVAGTPVITVLGGSDRLASPDEVMGFIRRVEKLGGEIRYKVRTGWKHGDTCRKSYTTKRLKWLFSH